MKRFWCDFFWHVAGGVPWGEGAREDCWCDYDRSVYYMYNPLVNYGIIMDKLPTSTGNSRRISWINLTHTPSSKLNWDHRSPQTINPEHPGKLTNMEHPQNWRFGR